uniref:AlNc14C3G460 protein n=1 Tax=Albugo laibachii Nc14 TaxID=890382 RepID=F0VZY2_9STRA|nr:AlNc14C3G460 [Albugo laibachii Nc14]|eukprot:CCA14353.1 AlNc14C3G460 [Albugo laibachii Nc14]
MSAVSESMRLYCAIYRAAAKMPTKDRKHFIRRRLRAEYDIYRTETDAERLRFLHSLAETQLETIQIQAKHLTDMLKAH